MKIPKNRIRLSQAHPSLLLNLASAGKMPVLHSFSPPVVVNQDDFLVDGYRRYFLLSSDEIEAVQMRTGSLFDAALALNQRTRVWDDIDCFLWLRWARDLGISAPALPQTRFSEKLFDADTALLSHLACRELLLRQALSILILPHHDQSFFENFLTQTIRLNANETASFIEMACDLKKILNKKKMEEVFHPENLAKIVENPSLNRKQKGEHLLKEMRTLRYPIYTKKSEQFSSDWGDFNFGQSIHTKKRLFLERGVLEISLTSSSLEEMKENIGKLYRSLDSPLWKKIWEEV